MYLPWWRCFVIFQAFLGNSFILKKKKLHENISWRHMMTKCHLYSAYLEFWIRDNVSERTHSPPQDDCKSLSVKTPKDKKCPNHFIHTWLKNIQRTKNVAGLPLPNFLVKVHHQNKTYLFCKVLERKHICKLKVDNRWPEDTAWFPFICLFVTVYFWPLTF